MSGLMPPGPLAYEGQVAVPSINRTFPPTTAFNNFNVPTIWTDTLHENAYILVSKSGGVADWVMVGGTPGNLETITTPDSTVVVPSAGNINFLNGTGFNITGSGSSITFSANAMTITAGTGLSGGGSLNLGGTVTISLATPVTVPHGGTGLTTLTTAYGVVCAGTTATGALQNAGAGTANQILVSNGSAALPTWQTMQVVKQVFTYTGGAQTYTPTSGMQFCIIEAVGGGGGGAGCPLTAGTTVAAGGGGGGGGYARKISTASAIGGSQTVTIGAGGAGGVGNNAGVGGGNTSVGIICVANGAGGGANALAANPTTAGGGAGGSGGTGDLVYTGQGGSSSFGIYLAGTTIGAVFGGGGGNSFFGSGANSVATTSGATQSNGNNAGNYGGGGGGAFSLTGGTAANGGAGSPGIVFITEYIW